MVEIKEVVVIGTGKVAHQLAKHLSNRGIKLAGIWGRNTEKAMELATLTNTVVIDRLTSISKNHLSIICITDKAIPEIIELLPINNRIATTSGSVRLEDLPKRNYLGVLYPLQTFSKGLEVKIAEVPFLIESLNKDFEEQLVNLAQLLSPKVVKANSEERYNLHIAAVMVNNFTNYLYLLAEKYLKQHQLDFKLLLPLIGETVDKLSIISPFEAQTGPAVRGDVEIINKHLESIKDEKTKEIYELFSKAILKEFKKLS